jgi:hypothetical protein
MGLSAITANYAMQVEKTLSRAQLLHLSATGNTAYMLGF